MNPPPRLATAFHYISSVPTGAIQQPQHPLKSTVKQNPIIKSFIVHHSIVHPFEHFAYFAVQKIHHAPASSTQAFRLHQPKPSVISVPSVVKKMLHREPAFVVKKSDRSTSPQKPVVVFFLDGFH